MKFKWNRLHVALRRTLITFKKQMWSCMSARVLSSALFQRSCATSCSSWWICPSTWLPREVSWVLRSSPNSVPVRFTFWTSSENKSVLSCCRACTKAWKCTERKTGIKEVMKRGCKLQNRTTTTEVSTPMIAAITYLVLASNMWNLIKLLFSLLDSLLYVNLHLNKLFLDTQTHPHTRHLWRLFWPENNTHEHTVKAVVLQVVQVQLHFGNPTLVKTLWFTFNLFYTPR